MGSQGDPPRARGVRARVQVLLEAIVRYARSGVWKQCPIASVGCGSGPVDRDPAAGRRGASFWTVPFVAVQNKPPVTGGRARPWRYSCPWRNARGTPAWVPPRTVAEGEPRDTTPSAASEPPHGMVRWFLA